MQEMVIYRPYSTSTVEYMHNCSDYSLTAHRIPEVWAASYRKIHADDSGKGLADTLTVMSYSIILSGECQSDYPVKHALST